MEESSVAVLFSAIMLAFMVLMDASSALLITTVESDVSSDNVALVEIAADNASTSPTSARVVNTLVMELVKLGLLPNAAAISTSVFKLSGAPFTSADVRPSKYAAVAFNASAADSAATLVLSALSAACNVEYVDDTAPDTDAADAVRVETSALSAVLSAVFAVSSDPNDTAIALTTDAMPLCRVSVSANIAVLRAASAAVKVAATVAIAPLTDKMALLRWIASVDNAALNPLSAAANDTDALLNALDSDAIALVRVDVSADSAPIMPASAAERAGMAVLLNDATALMRATISLDMAVTNESTRAIVPLFSVNVGLV
jgi:hypothetical protein